MENKLALFAVVNAAAGVGKAIDDFEKACSGLYAVNSTELGRHKARGDLFEAIDKYVESLEEENFGKPATTARDDAYYKIDRFLRGGLDDSDYAEYSAALDACFAGPAAAKGE